MKKLLLYFVLLAAVLGANGQVLKNSAAPWPVIEKQMRPWTRWWWMGSAVDEKNLSVALSTYAAAGIGGVEITPIYGVKGFENRYIDFLSPKWVSMLNFTVKKAEVLGMGVDMNTGTGWPFGGPQITPEFAASKLIIQQYQLAKGQTLTELIIVKDQQQLQIGAVLQALTAYPAKGTPVNLLAQVDKKGRLNYTPTADCEIYAIFSGKTLQKVKRAAPSGEGYTLDHLDQPSVNAYLARFDKAFAHRPQGVRAFFNDSYEVYKASWTPSFLQEFKQLKGYDLSLYIRELTGKDSTSAVVGRVKSDYRETMSNLLLDNFTRNWTKWAHGYKSITKNQSHGSPGNLLDLYAAVDIPETEIFGSSAFAIPGLRRDKADVRNVDPDPMMSRFASSAAHTQGKKLASSETFTWLTEHFKTSFSQAKPEAEQLFLSGINHIFYHGTTYTPADVPFPGWLFYASMNVVPANSLWPQLKGMNDYYSRCQSILQAGQSDNELLIYWPVYDQWGKQKGTEMTLPVHDVDVWLHPTEFYKQSVQLQKEGYSFDFASDRMLAASAVVNGKVVTAAAANPYQTLIVPECKLMPLQTLQVILALAKKGATVIFQQLPGDVPGLSQLENNRREFNAILAALQFEQQADGVKMVTIGAGAVIVAENLKKGLEYKNIRGEQLVETGLKFIRRKLNSGRYYYLVNHTAKTIDEWVPVNYGSKQVMILDAQSGDYGLAETAIKDNRTTVRIYLEPGETLFLKTGELYSDRQLQVAAARKSGRSRKAGGSASRNMKDRLFKSWTYLDGKSKNVPFGQLWKLHFITGGPVLPADQQMARPQLWTSLDDAQLAAFSGTGVYSTTFELPVKDCREYQLDLGQVNETAHIWINGKDAGYSWSIPYKKRIGQYLKKGTNTIRIEVANLMANRIADLDKKGVQWRNYHEINFVNIDYKPFDASGWKPMPSGLAGPVVLKGYK
jgi:hypothetical protein